MRIIVYRTVYTTKYPDPKYRRFLWYHVYTDVPRWVPIDADYVVRGTLIPVGVLTPGVLLGLGLGGCVIAYSPWKKYTCASP
jgi:hypothetical protein